MSQKVGNRARFECVGVVLLLPAKKREGRGENGYKGEEHITVFHTLRNRWSTQLSCRRTFDHGAVGGAMCGATEKQWL